MASFEETINQVEEQVVAFHIRFKPDVAIEQVRIDTLPEANWAIPGLVIFGAHPAPNQSLICSMGVICFYAFIEDLIRYHYQLNVGVMKRLISLPDKKPIPENKFVKFVDIVFELALATVHGKKSYVHCWGGHGRSGLAICLLYHFLYGISAEEAMLDAQRLHDMRVNVPPDKEFGIVIHERVRVPQTDLQREQLQLMLSESLDVTHPEYAKYVDINAYIKAKRTEIIQILSTMNLSRRMVL